MLAPMIASLHQAAGAALWLVLHGSVNLTPMSVVTLYKTPSPGTSLKSGEYYEIALDNPNGRDFILKEFHGHWDAVRGEKAPGSSSEILSPPDGYPSPAEGDAAFDERKLFRAKQGFLHGLTPIFNPVTLTQGEIYEFVDVSEEI